MIAISFIAIAFFNVSFPWLVLAAALTGWLGQRFVPRQFAAASGQGAPAVLRPLRPDTEAAATLEHGYVIDDTPTPPHARFKRSPGPLIMGVAFVGFVGGWTQQVLGPDALFAGAALAALVVTWVTFLPSFVFILVGGPLVESTHGKLQFTAPLTAVAAAVVGVIASSALFFIANAAYRTGLQAHFSRNSTSPRWPWRWSLRWPCCVTNWA